MEKRIKIVWIAGFFLPAINATVFNASLNIFCDGLIAESLFSPFFRFAFKILLYVMIIKIIFKEFKSRRPPVEHGGNFKLA